MFCHNFNKCLFQVDSDKEKEKKSTSEEETAEVKKEAGSEGAESGEKDKEVCCCQLPGYVLVVTSSCTLLPGDCCYQEGCGGARPSGQAHQGRAAPVGGHGGFEAFAGFIIRVNRKSLARQCISFYSADS